MTTNNFYDEVHYHVSVVVHHVYAPVAYQAPEPEPEPVIGCPLPRRTPLEIGQMMARTFREKEKQAALTAAEPAVPQPYYTDGLLDGGEHPHPDWRPIIRPYLPTDDACQTLWNGR